MPEGFQKLDELNPKDSKPGEAAAPKKEEQEVPKMSAQEFRIYNRMAEHMDMFVGFPVTGLSLHFH